MGQKALVRAALARSTRRNRRREGAPPEAHRLRTIYCATVSTCTSKQPHEPSAFPGLAVTVRQYEPAGGQAWKVRNVYYVKY